MSASKAHFICQACTCDTNETKYNMYDIEFESLLENNRITSIRVFICHKCAEELKTKLKLAGI